LYSSVRLKAESHLAAVTEVPAIISIWPWCIWNQIWRKYLHPIQRYPRYWHFSKFSIAAAWIFMMY